MFKMVKRYILCVCVAQTRTMKLYGAHAPVTVWSRYKITNLTERSMKTAQSGFKAANREMTLEEWARAKKSRLMNSVRNRKNMKKIQLQR